MNKILAALAAGMLLIAPAGGAAAQETVTINGVEATRVVIAPPRNGLDRAIRKNLGDLYYGAAPGTPAYAEARKLYYFYGARHFEPLWLSTDAGGKPVLSGKAQKILPVFESAGLTGLRPADYLTPDVDPGRLGTDPESLARFESAFSAAALRYAQDTHGGRLKPSSISRLITIEPDRLNPAEALIALAGASDPAAYFESLEPPHREFIALKQALKGFYDGTAEEPVIIPDGKTLKLGMRDARVPLVRKRLGLDAPGNPRDGDVVDIYDKAMVAAIEKFQVELGLNTDGVTGPATIAALNGGSATSKGDIVANMERWRWMPRDLGAFHVLVNIPEFRLYVERGDGTGVVHTTRVVVGKPTNQTPVFSDEIEHIVVNPYWNVPRSIATNEIAPILASDPGYIANNNMELLYGGKVVDASAVDWSSTSVNRFHIRQRPGAGNALGTVKFLFPNQHDVYLHDTPSKSLFERSYRAFSHGCVRVHNPWEFAEALLQNEPELTAASLEAGIGSKERWNNLERHVPVHIAYFTLRVDGGGTLRSYGDVYGHNSKIKTLLGE